MRRAVISLGLVLTACSPATIGQVAPVKEALQSGLGWYYRWIGRIPPDLDSIPCSVACFEKRSFAFCSTGPLAIDIETAEAVPPRVTSIVQLPVSFEHALTDFLTHRGPTGSQRGPTQVISIPVRDLARCDIDWHRTRLAASAALNERQVEGLRAEGLSLRYPLVCEGDPFYLLYLVKGDRIRSIWQFTIGPGRVDFAWSFDSDSKQRKIPERAVENLSKEMWYQRVR